jgi:hypothetical protein
MRDHVHYRTVWRIERFASASDRRRGRRYAAAEARALFGGAEQCTEIEGNLLLNEGIAVLLDLGCGLASPTAFSNAAGMIGVGDSNAAESAAQTGLQASTNKLYKGMEAGYPSRAAQTVTWRAQFGSSEGNFAWNEFTVANGSSDAAANLNRKVSAQGTKTAGQIWTIDLAITLS